MTGENGGGEETPPTPSEEGVSEAAQATRTRVDDVAEKIFNAIQGAIEGEDLLDVKGAMSFVNDRISHIIQVHIDSQQLMPQ